MTVSQSHTATVQANTLGSVIAMTVVITDPIQTMNMTGLRHRWRGSSLRRAWGSCERSDWSVMTEPPRGVRVRVPGRTSGP